MNLKEIENRLKPLILSETKTRKEIIGYLREIERQKLWQAKGYKSLRHYCTDKIGYDRLETRGLLAACGLVVTAAQLKDASPSIQKRIDALREWRRQKSGKLGVSAFVLMYNRTLLELARKNPKTSDDLFSIPGMGPKKIEAYGREILKTLGS